MKKKKGVNINQKTDKFTDKTEFIAIEDAWLIPENKIMGLRFGQLIYNAIYQDLQRKRKHIDKITIIDSLYEISGKRLAQIIEDFLEEFSDRLEISDKDK
jgi:hypothetical protein